MCVFLQDRKNALEEYIYDMRNKLDNKFAAYVQSSEKEQLLKLLQEAEDWLYSDDGEDSTKSVYVARLDSLKVLGDPITNRFREAEDRSRVISQLRDTINSYMSQATSGEEKFAHIDEKDKQSIVEKCATVQQWLEDQIARQTEKPKNVDPVLKAVDVNKKRDEIIYFATPILSRLKLKPPKVEGTQTPQSGTETPKEQPQQQAPPPETEQVEMDVD